MQRTFDNVDKYNNKALLNAILFDEMMRAENCKVISGLSSGQNNTMKTVIIYDTYGSLELLTVGMVQLILNSCDNKYCK